MYYVCVGLYKWLQGLWRPEKEARYHGYRQLVTKHQTWVLRNHALEEQQILLTTEPSLQDHKIVLFNINETPMLSQKSRVVGIPWPLWSLSTGIGTLRVPQISHFTTGSLNTSQFQRICKLSCDSCQGGRRTWLCQLRIYSRQAGSKYKVVPGLKLSFCFSLEIECAV